MSSFDGFMIEEATKKSQRIRELEQQLSEAAARIRALETSRDAYKAALDHVAYNLSLSVPLGCDEASHYRGQLCEAIGTAARALIPGLVPIKEPQQ